MSASALLVCVSVSHGNTDRIARAMADVLHADVVAPEDISAGCLGDYTLLGVGSGIFGGSHHPRLRGFVDRLPMRTGGQAFVFTTSGLGRAQHRPWERSLESVLRSKGYRVVGSFCCRGFDTFLPLRIIGGINKGHPDDEDVARARDFARALDLSTRRRQPTP